MSRLIQLKCFDDAEIVVSEMHIVKVLYTKGWGGEAYKIFLVDGHDHALDKECGKKLWESFKNKSDKTYM